MQRGALSTSLLCLLPALLAGCATPGPPRETGPYVVAGFSRVDSAGFGPPAVSARLRARDSQLMLGTGPFSFEALGETRLGVGIDYAYTRFVYDELAGRDRDLHRLAVPVHFEVPGERWRISGFVAPGISTSSNVMKDLFDEATSDDFQVAGRVEARRPVGGETPGAHGGRSLILGLAHDRTFGRSRTYPVLGLDLAPSEAVDVRLAWPDPALIYRAGGGHVLSARLFPAGHQWHVVTDDFSSDFSYRMEAWRARVNWNAQVTRELRVDVSLGYEFDRRHDFVGDGGRVIDFQADDAWFFAVGLRYGPAPAPLAHGAHFNR